LNRTVKNYTVAVLTAIIQATLNQTKTSRKYLCTLGAIEQTVFRLFNAKKEKQKRNSRGFIRAALQALTANDVIVGVSEFDPDSDQLRRSDRPSLFRLTTRCELWFRDNCSGPKDAAKNDNVVRALQAFNLLPEEIDKESDDVQQLLFDDQRVAQRAEIFTDETALTEIRNRVETNDAIPWEQDQMSNSNAEPQATVVAAAGTATNDELPAMSLNEITPEWWKEFEKVSPEYRAISETIPVGVADNIRDIVIEEFQTVAKVIVRTDLHKYTDRRICGQFEAYGPYDEHEQYNFAKMEKVENARISWNKEILDPESMDYLRAQGKTCVMTEYMREICARALFYADTIAQQTDRGVLILTEMLMIKATSPETAVFATEIPHFSSKGHPSNAVSAAIGQIERAIVSGDFGWYAKIGQPPLDAMLLIESDCNQMFAWRNVGTRQARHSNRQFTKPTRRHIYLTLFGRITALILLARRTGLARQSAPKKERHKMPTEKEGSLLKNAKRQPEAITIPVRTKDGITVRLPVSTSDGLCSVDLTAAELLERFGGNASQVGIESLDRREDHKNLRHRVVDLAKSSRPEVRKHLALREHEKVIAAVVPDVVTVLCERIAALQNVTLGSPPDEQTAEEVCKTALYHALTILSRVVRGLQNNVRKAAIEDMTRGADEEERPFTVDFLPDYAAQVSLAIETLLSGGERIMPIVTTEEELEAAKTAAGLEEAPRWRLHHERKIEDVNWSLVDATKPAAAGGAGR